MRARVVKGFGGGRVKALASLTATGDLNGDGHSDVVAGYVVEPARGGAHCVLGVFVHDDALGYRPEAMYPLARHGWPRRKR